MSGKGDTYRKVNITVFNRNFEKTFGSKDPSYYQRDKSAPQCPVLQYCSVRGCLDPNNPGMNQENCSCRACILRSIEHAQRGAVCEYSGEWYNIDGDCLAEK